MPIIEINNLEPKTVIHSTLAFTAPRINYGKNNIELIFYAFDSQFGRLRRKRIKLNRIGGRFFIKRREREICARFLALLAQGWNPFDGKDGAILTRLSVSESQVIAGVPVKDALKKYKDYVETEVQRKVMSTATRRTYFSYITKLLASLPASKSVAGVSTADLVRFIDAMKERNMSPKYCNSMIGWLKTLFGWLLERGMVKENPALPMKTETLARQQGRPTLTDEERETLFSRLRQHGQLEFLLACMMEYYTYIRPNELYRVKVRYIDFTAQTVTIPAEISKNRKTAKVTLPNVVVALMLDLKIDKHRGDDYLFGKGLKCGPKIGTSKQFGRYWSEYVACQGGIFPELGKRGIVFYSLKNTGIVNMLDRGVPSAVVRDQARHQDLTTTEIYARKSSNQALLGLREYE